MCASMEKWIYFFRHMKTYCFFKFKDKNQCGLKLVFSSEYKYNPRRKTRGKNIQIECLMPTVIDV